MNDSDVTQSTDVLVVGAGAAGQIAAIAAAQAGRSVALFEQMPQPGRKILATGGGRCNLTNLATCEEMAAAFGRQGRFMLPALYALEPAGLQGYMNDVLHVPTVVEENGRVFPASHKAVHVQNALHRCLDELGVAIRVSCPVERLRIENGKIQGVETRHRKFFPARSVILACGGRSWPELGGTGGGYSLAQQAGHTITPLTTALVPLITRENWPAKLAGVSVSGARIVIQARGQSKAGIVGDVLFTHKGLSGPVILNLSSDVAQQLAQQKTVTLKIEFRAGDDAETWSQRFDCWRTTQGSRSLVKLIQKFFPASLIELLCQQAGVSPQMTAAELSREGRQNLSSLLGGAELTVVNTEGFDTAFVTRGGVKLRDIDPETLQSKLQPGLFFAGELLDLDGPTGGYNLRWAFSSGLLAGASAARFAEEHCEEKRYG